MDEESLIKRLIDKFNVTYEIAKQALENNSWDILDATLYLERHNFIKSPKVDIFYSNKKNEYYNNSVNMINLKKDEKNKQNNDWENKKSSNRIFEIICEKIDIANNSFLEIKKEAEVLLKIPLTAVIILLFFVSWMIIIALIISLIFDIEFFLDTKIIDSEKVNKINKFFNNISKNIKDIREKIKKEFKND